MPYLRSSSEAVAAAMARSRRAVAMVVEAVVTAA